MATPKSKTSVSKRNQRRSHDGLKPASCCVCPKCGEKKLPHHVCKACGYYDNKEIIAKK